MSSVDPSDETARLAALQQHAILEDAPDPALDDLVRLAAQVCGAPQAAIVFVDADRQWLAARLGIEPRQLPRGPLCDMALRHDDIFEVADTTASAELAADPLVAGPPRAAWCAGAPLRTREGFALGALLVLDQRTRMLGADQRSGLQMLGRQAMALLEPRRASVLKRRAAEDTHIRERERLFRTIAENVPLPVLISDPGDGTILYANKAYGDLLGRPASDMIGQRTPDFYYDPAERDVLLQQLRRDGSVHNYELHIKKFDGTPRWVLASIHLIQYEDQPVLLSALNDVTERKQVEAELQDSQLLLQLVLDNIPQAVGWKDRDSVFLGCNHRFAENIGLADPAAIVGKTDYDLPAAEFADLYRADDQRVMESGIAKVNFEEPHANPDGSQSWLRTSKVPLRDRTRAIVGTLVMYEDITERKLEEQERARLKDDLIRAQAAALAELSTPLIPISNDTVVMPLIGAIDSRRAQQVMEALLEGITATHTQVAILDITGVPVVDTQVADALLRAAQAVRLLGARVVLTGIRPEVAQTLVGLGVDLTGIVTRSTLQSGIAFALSRAVAQPQHV